MLQKMISEIEEKNLTVIIEQHCQWVQELPEVGGGECLPQGEEGQTPRADQVPSCSTTLSLCCFLCHCEPPCVPCPMIHYGLVSDVT